MCGGCEALRCAGTEHSAADTARTQQRCRLPGPRLGWVALRGRKQQLCRALDSDKPGDSEHKGDNADDEIDRLLGLGKYAGSGVFGRSTGEGQASIFTNAEFEKPLAGGNTEVQETLADVVQMEVRRVRARAELEADMEERKQQLRAMGEEADKADLAAWEVRSAEERSKGLFFKSLYAVEKEKRQPVGKSIPGYYRVRSPFRLYLFSYLSAFLALVVVNDLAVVAQADPAAAAVGHANSCLRVSHLLSLAAPSLRLLPSWHWPPT
eukprot:XP_001697371.1 predicted protein [Chlamydomonas reinhardtii]